MPVLRVTDAPPEAARQPCGSALYAGGRMTRCRTGIAIYVGGANKVNLRQAQENFRRFGASDSEFTGNVRRPTAEEIPDSSSG